MDDRPGLQAAQSNLEVADRIALDCEAAGYHRYSDRLCLVQLTTAGRTYLLDPLEIDPAPALRAVLEDSGTEVVMHGADFDVRLIDRDLGIRVARLFDTQIAASLLGVEALGLSFLLENRLGIKLSKKYQKADWAQRPLPRPCASMRPSIRSTFSPWPTTYVTNWWSAVVWNGPWRNSAS